MMQAYTHPWVLLACILGTVASASAQGIINKSAYIPAPQPRVKKASLPVSTPTLHTAGGIAAAPPGDGVATVQQMPQSVGPGAEPPMMRRKLGKARAPETAKLDNGTIPQHSSENATTKQRAHNDSIPHQRKREDSIPKQRQLSVSLPAQRKPDDLLPRKQPASKSLHASAPSGSPPSGEPEGLKQKAGFSTPGGPSQGAQGNPGLQTGAPEAPSLLQSTGSIALGPQSAAAVPVLKPVRLKAGQEALRELLGEAAAAPAQHSTAGYQKAPAPRYAVQQGMREGYFDVWPAPAPCEGYYTVRAQSEKHSSQYGTDEAPRYSTQVAVSGAAAAPTPSLTGDGSAAPSAESGHVQAYSPQSLATEIPLSAVSPSEGNQDIQESSGKPDQPTSAASAPSIETDGAMQPQEVFLSRSESAPALTLPAATPEQAAPAQAPQQLSDMNGHPISIQALQPDLAEYGAYAPGPGTEPAALDLKMLSAVYNAGYRAGYEAARTQLTEHVRHASLVAASPQPSKEHLEVPEAVSKPPHPSQASSSSQQVTSQPQAYGSYGGTQPSQAGQYGSESPRPTRDAEQGTQKALAYSPEAMSAQPRHSYGNYAPAYAYQSHAYQGIYSKEESQKLLQATAHEQAASFGRTHSITSAGADAEAPGPGIAAQSFAAAPVVRSYPGEQQPASPAQAAAPAPSYTYYMFSSQNAQEISLAPAPSTSLAPATTIAYSGLSAHEAASAPAGTYKQQRLSAYASQPVLPPTSGPEDASARPSQAPSMSALPSYGLSASAGYAPGPQPSSSPNEAPGSGRLVTVAPVPAPSSGAGLTFGVPLPYAPAAAPVAYALAYAPVPIVLPSAYGAYAPAASMQGVAPSGSMQPVLAPSVGVSALPVLVPSAAPLPAPCEVCHRPEGAASRQSAAPEVVLSILDGSELAQYVTQEGSNANVVYFVARAAFSRPPTNFTAQDVTVANGTAVDVISEGACGRFLVKGYVEGEQAAGENGTAVELSIKAGMLRDCAGDVFPAASAAGTVSDRPTGWLQAPDMGMDNNASASGEPRVFLTLTFSQPVLSVSPADIRVNLTQSVAEGAKNNSSTQGQSGARRSLAEDASDCLPEASVQSSLPRQAPNGASKAYSFVVGLPSCFRGEVAIEYMGSAQTPRGVTSFPVKPFSFWHPTSGPRMGQARE